MGVNRRRVIYGSGINLFEAEKQGKKSLVTELIVCRRLIELCGSGAEGKL